jgi:hypothetical protein
LLDLAPPSQAGFFYGLSWRPLGSVPALGVTNLRPRGSEIRSSKGVDQLDAASRLCRPACVLAVPRLLRAALADPATVLAQEAAARYLHRNVFLSRQV